jgi:hypothetical protein
VTVILSIMLPQCELPELGIKHPLANFIDKSSDLNPTPPVAAITRLFGISERLSVTRLGRGLVAIVIIAYAIRSICYSVGLRAAPAQPAL